MAGNRDVIIGSGAASGILARALARSGRSVAVIESGPERVDGDFAWGEADTSARLMQAGGRIGSRGGVTAIRQGRCLGGSATVGFGVADSIRRAALEDWRERAGWPTDDLSAAQDRVLEELGATPDPADERAAIDSLLARGARTAGRWRARTVVARGRGLAGPVVAALEDARRAGAELVADSHAERLLMEGGRATLIRGPGMGREGERYILCAGALGTPELLRRSGLLDDNVSGLTLPRRLLVLARFGEPLRPGPPGGAWVFEDRLVLGRNPGGFAVEGASVGVATVAALSNQPLPVVRDLLSSWDRVGAAWCVVPEPAELKFDRQASPVAGRIDPSRAADSAAEGLLATAEMLLRSGAQEVYLPVLGTGPLTRSSSLSGLDAAAVAVAPAACVAPQGGCADVVDSTGKVRGTDNVWVCDASVFPSPAGLAPMVPLMALAQVRAQQLGG